MRTLPALAAAALVTLAGAAHAMLKPGDPAPAFSTQAALAGKPFAFDLKAALARGPVVLYFFPKAFTSGCTVEAHAFAEKTPEFAALGATVVGVSNDDIDTQLRFSSEACRDKFAVASDPRAEVISAYDARFGGLLKTASRISYVIDRSGRIVYAHEGSDPLVHVAETFKAVQALKAGAPAAAARGPARRAYTVSNPRKPRAA